MEEKRPKVKILVGYHKPAQLLKSDVFVPIHLGRALASEASKDGNMSEDDYQWMLDNMIGDDTGENISNKNRTFAELTGIYWAWKNYEKLGDPEYIGFVHYRRYFDANDVLNAIKNNVDIIAPEPYSHDMTVREQFISFHGVESFNLLDTVLKEQDKTNYSEIRNFFNGKKQHLCNIFVMKKNIFFNYCEWLFKIASEINSKIDFTSICVYNCRLPAFCAERLTSFFIESNKSRYNVAEIPYIYSEKQCLKVNNDHINIILAADNNYIKYAAVCIISAVENSSKDYFYNFYIINQGISDENQKMLNFMTTNYTNVKIYNVNISKYIEDYGEYFRYKGECGLYNMTTYYRFFIGRVFKEFNRVLYLDSDMLVLSDISKLYFENIDNYVIAATRDIYVKMWRRISEDMDNYIKDTLTLDNRDYFQAGVLLFNIKNFISENTEKTIFEKLNKIKKPRIVDQCILNSALKDRVKFIDSSWDYDCNVEQMVKHNSMALIKNMNVDEYNYYLKIKDEPKIVHYAGKIKPWNSPISLHSSVWWKYARMTPFYEEIIYRNTRTIIPPTSMLVESKFYKNFLQRIFSIKNNKIRPDKIYKVVTILGIKFKFKKKGKYNGR